MSRNQTQAKGRSVGAVRPATAAEIASARIIKQVPDEMSTKQPVSNSLPAALEALSDMIDTVEANHSSLHFRLRRILAPVDMGPAKGEAFDAGASLEPPLVDVVNNLTYRLRMFSDSQDDTISRLQV